VHDSRQTKQHATKIVLVQLRLTVHATGPDLVAYRGDGAAHSRWPITATDPITQLERLDQPVPDEPDGPHLATLGALDEALARQGYQRLTDWAPGPRGPTCEVTTRTT